MGFTTPLWQRIEGRRLSALRESKLKLLLTAQTGEILQIHDLSRHDHPYRIKPQITGFPRSSQLLQLLFKELNFFVAHVRVNLLQCFEAFDFQGEAKPLDSRLCGNDGYVRHDATTAAGSSQHP